MRKSLFKQENLSSPSLDSTGENSKSKLELLDYKSIWDDAFAIQFEEEDGSQIMKVRFSINTRRKLFNKLFSRKKLVKLAGGNRNPALNQTKNQISLEKLKKSLVRRIHAFSWTKISSQRYSTK